MAEDGELAPEGTEPPKRPSLARRFLTAFFAMLLLALVGSGAAIWGANQLYVQSGPAETDTVVWLPKGVGVTSIAKRLSEAGVIAHPLLFRVAVRLHGAEATLKAGEYEIPAHSSMAEIVSLLRTGKSLMHKLTAPEGLTSEQIVAIIAADPVLEGPTPDVPPEGSLLPETYNFTRGTTRAELLDRMAQAQKKLIAAHWSKRQEGLPIKTPQEAIILASIVEKETGIASERPRVAAVFINRLRKPMRLQSDPTIIYGLVGGKGALGRPIRRSELDRQTPYNTYQIDGLPPTPICNPGAAAILAVLDPPDSKELYFVADGSGGHAFSETLAGHERNVKNWRQIERDAAAAKPTAK
ncbi:MAG: endolytic transglycosylase MltG [Rhizobiales bacterium]|nr:endolytic transglycosylase MltG [Hyphomicrobiales bacterium]